MTKRPGRNASRRLIRSALGPIAPGGGRGGARRNSVLGFAFAESQEMRDMAEESIRFSEQHFGAAPDMAEILGPVRQFAAIDPECRQEMPVVDFRNLGGEEIVLAGCPMPRSNSTRPFRTSLPITLTVAMSPG